MSTRTYLFTLIYSYKFTFIFSGFRRRYLHLLLFPLSKQGFDLNCDSCQLCRLYFCPSDSSYTSWGPQCTDRVTLRIFSIDVLSESVFRAVLASFFLHEELGHLGRLGCTLCLLGSFIIVLHAPEDTPVDTVSELLEYAYQPGQLTLTSSS